MGGCCASREDPHGDAHSTWQESIVDTHIHLSRHYGGGLINDWHPEMPEGFQRDWSEEDYLASVNKGPFRVKQAIFVECFNRPAVEEAKWVLEMVDDPKSVIAGLVAQINVQKGAAEVNAFLDQVRDADGKLPVGLKGARMVFMATENKKPDACLDETFHEGLEALGKAGLHWEFCCNPSMAPNLATVCAKFPDMVFVIDHCAHNGNDGGEMEQWGPAIDKLGELSNTYMKMGAVEEWEVENPGEYMDRAIKAFGFDRVLFESNWFVSEAMGHSYDRTPNLLKEACDRAGATETDLRKVFARNARKVYKIGAPRREPEALAETFAAEAMAEALAEGLAGPKLNILLQEDLTIRGGAQLWLMNCGARLRDAGHTVTFLLPEDSLLRPDIEGMEGVTLRTYEHAKSAEDPESYRELFTELLTPANVCVTLVRQRRGAFQNVDFMASCIDKADLKTFLVAKTGTPDASYEKCFYGGALLEKDPPQSTVITIADYTRQFIIDNMGVDGKYITNIYNGTDTNKFKRTDEMTVECKKRYPLKEGDFVVGCIGSFEQRKGQKDLLEAAKILVDDGRVPNVHVLMVGEGPDKEMLVKLIEERGLSEHATLFDFTKEPFYVFERCNVIALPSYKEGLPNVLLEALAMEKPCVASRIMGCPEVVRDGVTGYCFECGNVAEIADSIAKIHALDADALATMAKAGKELVFEQHDKAKQFEKILEVIQSKAC